jgi:hypothetical protein
LSAGTNDVTGSTTPVEATDQAGTYALSESGVPGYTQTSLTCDNVEGEVTEVTIGLGENVNCIFINDDDAPSLTLQKTVINDSGGNGVASDWTLSAGSNNVTGSATPVEATDQAGTYALSESVVQGYAMTSLTCDNVEGEVTSVTIGLGENVNCIFVNDDLTVGIDIEKSTNGDDADTPTGPELIVGDAVNWEYVVTNPGLITLSTVVVTDDMGVTPVYQSGDTNGDDLLDPSETWIYTATGVAVAGQYANIGTVTAVVGAPETSDDAALLGIVDAGVGDTITDTDPSHYLAIGLASLGDTVWNDANSNGVQDDGEKGIAGAKVVLTLPDGTVVATATTDANGKYLFTDLIPGTYTATIDMSSIPPPDEGELRLTTASSFTVILAAGDNDLDSDFGVVAVLPVTGINTRSILRIALALLLAGALAVLLTTRRRREQGDLAT